jgi:hypothetical protein
VDKNYTYPTTTTITIVSHFSKKLAKFLFLIYPPFYYVKVLPFFQKKSRKISVTVLTPLWRSRKYPYLRGDTGGGTAGGPPIPLYSGEGAK